MIPELNDWLNDKFWEVGENPKLHLEKKYYKCLGKKKFLTTSGIEWKLLKAKKGESRKTYVKAKERVHCKAMGQILHHKLLRPEEVSVTFDKKSIEEIFKSETNTLKFHKWLKNQVYNSMQEKPKRTITVYLPKNFAENV